VLDATELTAERLRPCVDAIALRVEGWLARNGHQADVEVIREYRLSARRSTADAGPEVFDAVLIGMADELRAEVLLEGQDIDGLVRAVAEAMVMADRGSGEFSAAVLADPENDDADETWDLLGIIDAADHLCAHPEVLVRARRDEIVAAYAAAWRSAVEADEDEDEDE